MRKRDADAMDAYGPVQVGRCILEVREQGDLALQAGKLLLFDLPESMVPEGADEGVFSQTFAEGLGLESADTAP